MSNLNIIACVMMLCFAVGCRDASSPGHPHDGPNAHSHESASSHDHAPPHGGTPVLVADDQFHLELVLNAANAKMQAYVLDGHMEGYVQVPETNFVMVAKSGEHTEELRFNRVGEPGSAELPATSALFEAQSDWLKSAKEFEGSIPAITLNGKTFTNVSFGFPKGSKHVH